MVELLLGRRVHLVEHRHLVGRERPLAVVAEHARAHGVAPERVELADLEEGAVDHLKPVGPARHEDAAEHVVEMVARVVGDVDPAREHRHLDAGREVGRSEDDRLEPRRGAADLVHVDQATRRLDLRLDPHVADREARLLLDLGQQQVQRNHLGRRLDLGQHDLVQPLTGVAHDLDHVPVGPLGVPGVDPHAENPVIPGQVLHGVDDLGSCALLLQGSDRVLEVEERHVSRDGWRLGQELLVGTRGREAGTARQVARACGHGPRVTNSPAFPGVDQAAATAPTQVKRSAPGIPPRGGSLLANSGIPLMADRPELPYPYLLVNACSRDGEILDLDL